MLNIAEIRKKKKKPEKIKKKNEYEEKEVKKLQEEVLPVPKSQEVLPDIPDILEENEGVNIQLIDEEAFYLNRSKVEDKERQEYLCFLLGDEEYGVSVELAKEVLKYREITEVPKTTDIIIGIIAIRGEMVPVFDIKKLLAIEDDSKEKKGKKLVLFKILNESVCVIVDKITQIRKIAVNEILSTPMNINNAKQEFIKGVALIDKKYIRIIDIDKMLSF